jgi:hypothetical protein
MKTILMIMCAKLIISNDTGSWTPHDYKALKRNKNLCIEKFGKEAPCMVKFHKKETNVYHITCGALKNKE